jgi:hypothetical protein
MSSARYPWRWMDWSIGSIHSSKLSFAASTVWPSTPVAERSGICDRFFCTRSRVTKAVSPVEWSACRPRTIQLPLTASPIKCPICAVPSIRRDRLSWGWKSSFVPRHRLVMVCQYRKRFLLWYPLTRPYNATVSLVRRGKKSSHVVLPRRRYGPRAPNSGIPAHQS